MKPNKSELIPCKSLDDFVEGMDHVWVKTGEVFHFSNFRRVTAGSYTRLTVTATDVATGIPYTNYNIYEKSCSNWALGEDELTVFVRETRRNHERGNSGSGV